MQPHSFTTNRSVPFPFFFFFYEACTKRGVWKKFKVPCRLGGRDSPQCIWASLFLYNSSGSVLFFSQLSDFFYCNKQFQIFASSDLYVYIKGLFKQYNE